MVMELLVADQPARETSHDPDSKFWNWAEKVEVTESRFPASERWSSDTSHPAMSGRYTNPVLAGVRGAEPVLIWGLAMPD